MKNFFLSICCFILLFSSFNLNAQDNLNILWKGFLDPPHAAKPLTWWHWTAGNVTKEGITKDLEWMKRVGIGGFQAIDVSFGVGQTTEKKVIFFTPEWFDAIRHAAAEAQRLGLDMTMVTSAGWSETGGPWVKPEEAIKKLVWSEMNFVGGKNFSGKLPMPPIVNGPIRNMKRKESLLGGGKPGTDPEYYADQYVIAYRTPEDETNMASLKPILTTSGGDTLTGTELMDDDLNSKISLPTPKSEKPVWIQYEFAKPFKARAFSIALGQTGLFGSASMRSGYVEASDDGKHFFRLLSFPGPQHDIRALPVRTFSFPEVNSRFYRVVFIPGSGISTVGGPDDVGGFMGPATPPAQFDLNEAIFFSGGRINRWEDKADFAPMFEYESIATPALPESSVIQKRDIVDLTASLDKEGILNWNIPPGNWTVLRIGYSLTGAKNGPAVVAGTGFEVDKLNRKNLESYYRAYVDPIAKALGPLFGQSMKYFLVDSYEADAQNWTTDMVEQFKKRRGYDPVPFLPVMAGRVVISAEVSDRFLWDLRRTLADLLAENHYAVLTELAHKQGIRIYSEAAGISMPIIQDALMNKGRVDIPMGEFGMSQGLGSGAGLAWKTPADLEADHAYRGAGDRMNAHQADVREAASAAHIYGKQLVAAESWTGGGYESPSSMKTIGDYWNTQGINQFIFHTSAHQPLDTKPGNAMVGTHINRNITWAELAPPFMKYLARNQYLLQQGRFVGDIVYFLGESIPSAVPYWKKIKPEAPAGYDYDFINTEILLDSMECRDGNLVLPNGMVYRLLVLPETGEMTPRILNKIRDLVSKGAIVVGPKPIKSPSLESFPEADGVVRRMAAEVWGDADGELVFAHAYGKGKIYWNAPLEGILAEIKLSRDLEYNKPHANTYITWIHRRTKTAEIYFITNRRAQRENLQLNLRVTGLEPELWHPDRGTREKLGYEMANGITTVKLSLDPLASAFIVFEKSTSDQKWEAPSTESKTLATLSGPWELHFQPGLGAPERIKMDSLVSWTKFPNDSVRYFGGNADYLKSITAQKSWFQAGSRIILDLGNCKDIAVVRINGRVVDTLWKAPYQSDITEFLKPGQNEMSIQVTNEWNNRIAGDKKMPPGKKILSSAGLSFGNQNQELEESGLLGPVDILSLKKK